MYGKIFESIYDGSLAEDWRALITFQQMIILCDADGRIDMTALAISRRTGIPIEHIKAGIQILESPDPSSRTPGEEGRRIILLDQHRDWGWMIVNHTYYKGLQDYDVVRAQTKERVRRYRERQKDVTQESVTVTKSNAEKRHTNTNTNTRRKDPKDPADLSPDDLLAAWMYGLIIQINPKHKPPPMQSWVRDIRLMRERDGKTHAEIRGLFSWANNHTFWRRNILSPATLRKQWDRLTIQRSDDEKHGGGNAKGRIGRSLEVLARETENRRQRDVSHDAAGDDQTPGAQPPARPLR